jgi:hypothetical protein
MTQGREASAPVPVEKILVRIRVGTDRMAASDDPVFLQLGGPAGRDFRLLPARGKAFRKGKEDTFVLGSPQAEDTNVANPALNDPGAPPLDLGEIHSVRLVKGFEPIPNVRGMGEMDDRLEVEEIEVSIHARGRPPVRYLREGSHWLGLVCGLSLELARQDDPA